MISSSGSKRRLLAPYNRRISEPCAAIGRLWASRPVWAILSQPDKAQGRWDAQEFLPHGARRDRDRLSYPSSLGLAVGTIRALDFPLWRGPPHQALAGHFDEVVGIDIAPSMIELARLHDRTGRCRFVLNETDRLAAIASGTVDFVYSNIVLQHVEPRFTRRYLAEFVRVLRPGGLLVFQLPAELVPVSLRGYKALVPEPVRAAWRRLRRCLEFPRMEATASPATRSWPSSPPRAATS